MEVVVVLCDSRMICVSINNLTGITDSRTCRIR
jgi:hypothetical protein